MEECPGAGTKEHLLWAWQRPFICWHDRQPCLSIPWSCDWWYVALSDNIITYADHVDLRNYFDTACATGSYRWIKTLAARDDDSGSPVFALRHLLLQFPAQTNHICLSWNTNLECSLLAIVTHPCQFSSTTRTRREPGGPFWTYSLDFVVYVRHLLLTRRELFTSF